MEGINTDNEEFQKALQIIQFTHRSLFLTGKAGTGKSTFLRYISETTKKKHVILAPTGIAAINAGGSTLHSFFKIPFHPLLPTDNRYNVRNMRKTLRYSGEKAKLLREVELIIIDEISMVRADIIDFIDRVLRVYNRNMREPFGGKQLLLVGDIYQLEPVVREEDRKLLSPFYHSQFFFDAKVFAEFQLVSIELTKVYRQSNPTFIHILDNIRTSHVTAADLDMLNHQVGAKIDNQESSLSITLSTRRDTVDYINTTRLAAIPGEASIFEGTIEGDFPENNLPAPLKLELKVGAQVLFVRNDKEKRWVNGTLGTVIAFYVDKDEEQDAIVYVRTEDGKDLAVEQEIWSNIKYTFNEKEQKIEEDVLGTFHQLPLRLAWAITVHKSQGLTFKNVKIDFTGGVFAGGQTYVALSRCRSLEGISLTTPIRREDIFVKAEVARFAKNYNNHQLIHAALEQSKADRLYHDTVKAFDAGNMQAALDNFFLAIHCRYDIERPLVRRFIRRKLDVINQKNREIKRLTEEIHRKGKFLKKLAVEYVVMGRECEKEHFTEAAIRNFEKALELCPDIPEAKRRLKKLKKK